MTAPPNDYPKIAVPDKASKILTAMGYPVGAKYLRNLVKQGKVVAAFTGKRYLVNIESCVRYFEQGDNTKPPSEQGGIRRVEVG